MLSSELNPSLAQCLKELHLPTVRACYGQEADHYGLFRPFELVGFVVALQEGARQKIAAKCRRIGRELNEVLRNPRPP